MNLRKFKDSVYLSKSDIDNVEFALKNAFLDIQTLLGEGRSLPDVLDEGAVRIKNIDVRPNFIKGVMSVSLSDTDSSNLLPVEANFNLAYDQKSNRMCVPTGYRSDPITNVTLPGNPDPDLEAKITGILTELFDKAIAYIDKLYLQKNANSFNRVSRARRVRDFMPANVDAEAQEFVAIVDNIAAAIPKGYRSPAQKFLDTNKIPYESSLVDFGDAFVEFLGFDEADVDANRAAFKKFVSQNPTVKLLNSDEVEAEGFDNTAALVTDATVLSREMLEFYKPRLNGTFSGENTLLVDKYGTIDGAPVSVYIDLAMYLVIDAPSVGFRWSGLIDFDGTIMDGEVFNPDNYEASNYTGLFKKVLAAR